MSGPWRAARDWQLWLGDARAVLPTLAAGSVHACITSPPYYALRSYLPNGHADKAVELGLEDSPAAYVANLVAVLREVRRVLRDDGTLWLNLGDSMNNRSVARPSSHQGGLGFTNESIERSWADQTKLGLSRLSINEGGLKEKDLLMMPSRVALALQADGWIVRSMIPWVKRSSMPESVDDRPTTAVEYLFLLAKSGAPTYWTHRDHAGSRTRPAPDYRWQDPATGAESREPVPGWRRVNLWDGHDYFYDATAVALPMAGSSVGRLSQRTFDAQTGGPKDYGHGVNGNRSARRALENLKERGTEGGRNRRNADWFFDSLRAILDGAQGLLADEDGDPLALAVNPQGYDKAHFATFPARLVEPLLLAGTSARGCCPTCLAPWVRVVERAVRGERKVCPGDEALYTARDTARPRQSRAATGLHGQYLDVRAETTGWRPTCTCGTDAPPVPAVVLDPFSGAGTVSLVARKHGRHSVGIELSLEYCRLQAERLQQLGLPGLAG